MTAPRDWRRELHSKARRNADRDTARIRQADGARRVIAVVVSVNAAAAADGVTATVNVQWRGGSVLAAGWNAAQTFQVGQPVMCDLIDGQLLVDYPIVGQP